MLGLTLFYCLILVCYVGAYNSGDVNAEEPRCYSRFDYEFKTLQSVVTLTESDRYLREITAKLQNEIEELKLEKQRMYCFYINQGYIKCLFSHSRIDQKIDWLQSQVTKYLFLLKWLK